MTMTRATAATPACLLGMLLRMAYKAKKYHSGDGSAKWEAIEIKGKESSDENDVGSPKEEMHIGEARRPQLFTIKV